MGLFYKATFLQCVKARNKIFLEKGEKQLIVMGFQKSPFKSSFYGKNNVSGYSYDYCRIKSNSQLECITVHISKGDRWIKFILNIFHLMPNIDNLNKLSGIDGMKFKLPPNSISEMRLRSDDYKGAPIFRIIFYPEHKIRSYHSKQGFTQRLNELGALIEKDMLNIDSFIKRWHELHKAQMTDWNGEICPASDPALQGL